MCQPRLQMVDLASEQMLLPLPDQLEEDREAWDEAALVAHVDELIAAAQQEEVGQEPKDGKKRRLALTRKKQSTSVMNPSTVWFGQTPIVLREDLATPTYYTFCQRHHVCGRHCRKDIQINRPDKDTVVRTLVGTTVCFYFFNTRSFTCVLALAAQPVANSVRKTEVLAPNGCSVATSGERFSRSFGEDPSPSQAYGPSRGWAMVAFRTFNFLFYSHSLGT